MNRLRNIIVSCGVLALLLSGTLPACAKLPIDVEVAMETGLPLTAPQQWAQLLGQMELGSVRLRGIRAGDRPQLEDRSVGGSTRYRLLVVLNKRNELVFPEHRFRFRDRKKIQQHLEQMPAQAAYHAADRGRFGLTEKQFRQVYAELSLPVNFSTKEQTADAVIAKLKQQLTVPVTLSDNSALKISPNNSTRPIGAELQNFSTGTSLAYALRCKGLTFRPEQLPGDSLRIRIAPYNSQQESWPIGWKPAVSPRNSAPQLFVSRTIELNGFTLSQALTALAPALKIQVVMDDWILAQRQIVPSTIQVSLPNKKTFLLSAVRKLASQARLSVEVRVDEQEQPFLWLTRFGKSSRPAVK